MSETVLDNLSMRSLQITAVVLCTMLNALDGFDVLAISFAAPGIAAEWAISRAELGVVLAMELVGMSVGSVLLGNLADRIGRRPVILACLILMSAGMYLASVAHGVNYLLVVRFLTGIGIGGMLATTNAMVAESSNARRRHFNITVMAAGYPLGIILGGSIASVLLAHFDWRAVFLLGASVALLLVPLVWFLMPESISYLLYKRAPDALLRVNATLKRMGHPLLENLPDAEKNIQDTKWRELFSPGLARTTLLFTVSYLAHLMTFYFILKWVPKIVVDMGFTASSAGGVLVWANVGGLTGALMLGWLTHYFRVRTLVLVALSGAVVMINVFGQGQPDLGQLALISGVAGFFTNSAVVGLYALFAQYFPANVRAGGTGFVIGIGRAGSALGPIIAGVLFEAGHGLGTVAFVMALGSLLAALMLVMLRD